MLAYMLNDVFGNSNKNDTKSLFQMFSLRLAMAVLSHSLPPMHFCLQPGNRITGCYAYFFALFFTSAYWFKDICVYFLFLGELVSRICSCCDSRAL